MYKTILKQNQTINNLFNVKFHIGENKEKWNPLINNYFFSFRHGVYSFNLNQSLRLLKKLIYL
jgi:ribosomal protein S2